MGIRTGAEYRESLKDGRAVFVGGQRVADVTTHPAFQGVIETLCSLYDMQHENRELLTYPSPKDGKPVALSFLMAETEEEIERRIKAEEFRATATFGLMGRLPDFCSALVADSAAARESFTRSDERFGLNLHRYYEECRDGDLCLTHALVDPQVDRSKGPAEQADPFLALRLVRETDRGIIVRGARMLATLAPFANDIWVGPFYPRKPGEEPYALCFAIPVAAPGLKLICREAYDAGRSGFDRPLSSRFDEEDALVVFDDVLIPWERVFINGDVEAMNYILYRVPGYSLLQAITRGTVKMRFLTGLACYLAETIGRTEAPHYQAMVGELVAYTEMLGALLHTAGREVVDARREGKQLRSLAGVMFVAIPELQMKAADAIRKISGSGLIMTPTESDFANSELAGYLEKYLPGRGTPARQRVQLFKLAWDMVGEAFGSRQLQYEWFYAGDPIFNRARFYRSPVVRQYKKMVDDLLARAGGCDGSKP